MNAEVSQLEQKLAAVIRPRGRMLTAFSGGVDSTVVAAVARRVLGRDNAPAAIGDSASVPRRELDEARAIARQLDLDLIEAAPAEQDDDLYVANAADRCFHCKTHLYIALRAIADIRGIEHIANGSNVDDLGDYRPGLEAAAEARVISPLVEAGMTKADVRALAEALGLPNADKPAAACLASRIPYGTAVTPQRLATVERAEQALYDLGFRGFRVRHHETVARIEAPRDQMPRLLDPGVSAQVVDALRRIGYTYVTLDLAGFSSGSGNLLLQIENRVGRDES
ncbi:MAG: ATP-dependent sacrificial sulfur transferase LarE [Phycisphaera sp.]|nr:ATP-dependent sacrificial sulfur transferase LarE [Phycisphaera sp.]